MAEKRYVVTWHKLYGGPQNYQINYSANMACNFFDFLHKPIVYVVAHLLYIALLSYSLITQPIVHVV